VTNSRFILILLPVLALSACAQPPRAIISQVDPDQRSFVTSSAETTTTYLNAEGDAHQFCAGVSPDATYSESSSGGFSLSFLNFGGAPSNEVISEENSGDEMVGRTPALLLAREILYRACEMSKNAGLSSEQQIDIFLRTMETASAILQNETAKTSISISTQFMSKRAQEIGSGGSSKSSLGLVQSGEAAGLTALVDPANNAAPTSAPPPAYTPPPSDNAAPPSDNAARQSIYGN
jgi:hypothetical protein